MRLHLQLHGPWHLADLHPPRLRRQHVRGAMFALALAIATSAGLQAAAQTDDPVRAAEEWATQPYWWFVENVMAWAHGGFNH